jgi:transcriptional antiterminator RfaH
MVRMADQETRWYAIYCKPREDERAELHLTQQGFDVFRPKQRVRRRRRGGVAVVIESLFPRYLFVCLDDANEDWAPIRSTRGVEGLVRFGGRTPPVPSSVVDWLQSHCDEYGCVPDPAPDYQKGDRLVVKDGLFAGYEGLFYGRRAEDRVTLLLTMMAQPQKVAFPETALERV